MQYITCTQKKSHPKVSIAVCLKCKGMKRPDYRAYIQPSLFPAFVQDRPFRKPIGKERVKIADISLSDKPEQLSLI